MPELEDLRRQLEDVTAERDDYKWRWETLGRIAKRQAEKHPEDGHAAWAVLQAGLLSELWLRSPDPTMRQLGADLKRVLDA